MQKRFFKSLALIVFGIGVGVVVFYVFTLYEKDEHKSGHQDIKKPMYWVAPMDPNYKRDKPGKSPMGMDLVPVYEESSSDGIKISPDTMNNIGVKVEPVKYRNLHIIINSLGVIKENENHVEHIHTYENGWIRKLEVAEIGSEVKKDELIAQLYSPKLLEAEQELVLALQNRNTDKNQKITDYTDRTDYVKAAISKLEALGISQKQIKRIEKNKKADMLIDIYAPITGIVSELGAKEGMYVTPQQNLMTIVNLKSVWLSAEVFPHQIQYLKIGDEIKGKVKGINHIFKGKVTFISPTIDPVTRTVAVRATLDNTDELLKPNMYMDVSIVSKTLPRTLSIPDSAIIRLKDINYVIIQNKDDRFIAQEVKLGIETQGYVQVLSGLNESDKIVTSALFLIDSESNVQASLKRLNLNQAKHQANNKPSVYQAMGVVKNIDFKKHSIVVSHEPIKALNWPSMTMHFSVQTEVSLENLKPEEKIHFEFVKKKDSYEIIKIMTH
ncbi:MAG: efflux RND transporter periplasmic adaptor subunit [Gammaproteobacteria bacterium]|nr:MAG: efflux RND transporter periplasmic adaptor subunit [Gammaproteobacteria bacterium]